jgi:hypothetical protein
MTLMRHIAAALLILACGPGAAQAAKSVPDRILGICQLAQSHLDSPPDAYNYLEPALSVSNYMFATEHRKIEPAGAVTILRQPVHGRLTSTDLEEQGSYFYTPTDGYLGFDEFRMRVEMSSGLEVELRYFVHVLDAVPERDEAYNPYEDPKFCPPAKGIIWRMLK